MKGNVVDPDEPRNVVAARNLYPIVLRISHMATMKKVPFNMALPIIA